MVFLEEGIAKVVVCVCITRFETDGFLKVADRLVGLSFLMAAAGLHASRPLQVDDLFKVKKVADPQLSITGALAYQVDKEHFVVAYWCKIVLVNLFVDADGLESAIKVIRNKYRIPVDFNWMADR